MSPASFVEIGWRGHTVSIEHQLIAAQRTAAPLIVFLHEGLGSLAMWKDFPQRLCQALGWRGLVYSRPGYGRSTPRRQDEDWACDFMHRQAYEVLPALLDVLQLPGPLWLLGHSDGGSIALLYAARHAPAGCIVMAPHIVVEDLSVASIEQARTAYQTTDLRSRLARYHDDPDSAFWGWNRIWLDPGFRSWSIEDEIAAVSCPLLAMQGVDDEYGTLDQIRGIARRVPQTRLLAIANCGHSPHRDQPEAVIEAVVAFVAQGDTARPMKPPSSHSLHAAPQAPLAGASDSAQGEPGRGQRLRDVHAGRTPGPLARADSEPRPAPPQATVFRVKH